MDRARTRVAGCRTRSSHFLTDCYAIPITILFEHLIRDNCLRRRRSGKRNEWVRRLHPGDDCGVMSDEMRML